MGTNFLDNKDEILAILRRQGPRRIIELVRLIGCKRNDLLPAIESLDKERWLLHDCSDRTRLGVRTRRDRVAVMAQNALDARVGERALHELLALSETERETLACLSRDVETTRTAAWTADGGDLIRDEDEPRAGQI